MGECASVKLLPPLTVANAMKRGTQSLDLGSKLLARAFAIACIHRDAVKTKFNQPYQMCRLLFAAISKAKLSDNFNLTATPEMYDSKKPTCHCMASSCILAVLSQDIMDLITHFKKPCKGLKHVYRSWLPYLEHVAQPHGGVCAAATLLHLPTMHGFAQLSRQLRHLG